MNKYIEQKVKRQGESMPWRFTLELELMPEKNSAAENETRSRSGSG